MPSDKMKEEKIGDQQQEEEERNAVSSLLTLSKDLTVTASFDFSKLTKLDLYQADLNESTFPDFLPTHLPNLRILFCMKNRFREVPSVIGKFPKLSMVSFKSNAIKSIHPDALSSSLRWLILTDNQLSTLPNTIGRCTKLQKLMLSGNQIGSLPKEIENCKQIELIRLSSNQLTEPPMQLLTLPNLAWIALSENPFLQVKNENQHDGMTRTTGTLKIYPQNELDDPTQGIILGKGASGITRKYTIASSSSVNVDVAVKEFYSNITSDGNPQIEKMISYTTATKLNNSCPSLIQILGQTKKGNLIMELLMNYQVLAQPPTLQSCSRDVYDQYDNDTNDDSNNDSNKNSNHINWMEYVTFTRMVYLVQHLLQALVELHSLGISHGDFYGHNILFSTKNEKQIWLTDFGAAFFYCRNAEYGMIIERIECRAFGHLLEEVLDLLLKKGHNLNDDNEQQQQRVVELQLVIQQMIASCRDSNNISFQQLYSKWGEYSKQLDLDEEET